MQQKLKEHINQNFPFLHDKKLLIAISGGVDSVVLTHLLHQLPFTISLAHCNFKLRKNDSDLDEKFVVQLGAQLKIKTFTTQFETEKIAKKNKQSIQIAARELRYHWFDELQKTHHFDYVLTAHHADDTLETFLINLSRGTGLEGLTGIPAINKNIVRPLLLFSRDEIIRYAKENNILWREDQSNASTKYVRNKIRHQIVPVLKEINPNFLESFKKTLTHLQESQQIVDDTISDVRKDVFIENRIDIQKLIQLSNPKPYLYQLLKPYGFTEWNDIANLLTAQSGKQVFSKTHRLLKNREELLLIKNTNNNSLPTKFYIHENDKKITNPIHLTFKTVEKPSTKNNHTIYVDKDLLKFPLIVRKWEKGDYFYPVGMRGKKKVSKYFKDKKMSLLEKENCWLLCNNDNRIIWIEGKRQDNCTIINPDTKNILKITKK